MEGWREPARLLPPWAVASHPPREGVARRLQRHPCHRAPGHRLWATRPSCGPSLSPSHTCDPPEACCFWPSHLPLCRPAWNFLPPAPPPLPRPQSTFHWLLGLSPGGPSRKPPGPRPPTPWFSHSAHQLKSPLSRPPSSCPLLGSGPTAFFHGRAEEGRDQYLSPSPRPGTEEVLRGHQAKEGTEASSGRQSVKRHHK